MKFSTGHLRPSLLFAATMVLQLSSVFGLRSLTYLYFTCLNNSKGWRGSHLPRLPGYLLTCYIFRLPLYRLLPISNVVILHYDSLQIQRRDQKSKFHLVVVHPPY